MLGMLPKEPNLQSDCVSSMGPIHCPKYRTEYINRYADLAGTIIDGRFHGQRADEPVGNPWLRSGVANKLNCSNQWNHKAWNI